MISKNEAILQKVVSQMGFQSTILKRLSTLFPGEIEKIQKRMEETTSDINWMKVALEEWKDAAKNGEEINQIMDQFTKEDQKKMDVRTCDPVRIGPLIHTKILSGAYIFQSLETKRGNIETDINKYRQQLSDAYEEQKSLEKVLDNTAQMYQKTHMERQELIGTWRKAVADLHAREKMIQSTMKVFKIIISVCFYYNFINSYYRSFARRLNTIRRSQKNDGKN